MRLTIMADLRIYVHEPQYQLRMEYFNKKIKYFISFRSLNKQLSMQLRNLLNYWNNLSERNNV